MKKPHPTTNPVSRIFNAMGMIAMLVSLLIAAGLVSSFLGVLEVLVIAAVFFMSARMA